MRTLSFLSIATTLVLVSCTGTTPASSTSTQTQASSDAGTQVFSNPVSPNNQLTDPHHGKVMRFSIGALSGVNAALANGAVTGYGFEDHGSVIGIQLNIAPAPEGSIYEAWAQSDASHHVLLGTLSNDTQGVQHSLRFDTDQDLSSYPHIIITLQQNGDLQTPGEVVATGTLKDTKR